MEAKNIDLIELESSGDHRLGRLEGQGWEDAERMVNGYQGAAGWECPTAQ